MNERWIMRDGKAIYVDDMTESHAKNTLKMLIRKHYQMPSAGVDFMAYADWNGGEFYK